MTDRIDTVLTQQTICDDCGRWIDHDAAHWTDDGASYCTSCRAIYACDRIDTVNRLLDAKNAEIERLRVALEFYADNKNWNDGKWENDQPNTLTLVPSSATRDRGRVALAALSGEGQP